MRPLKLFKSLDELFGVISINVKRLCPRGHEALKAVNDFMSALVFHWVALEPVGILILNYQGLLLIGSGP